MNNILIVEGDRDVADWIETVIRRFIFISEDIGFIVIVDNLGSAEEFLAKDDEACLIDLCLLDFDLPGGQGTNLVPALRLRARECRILLMDGNHDRGLVVVAESRLDGFLPKPIDIVELSQKIQNLSLSAVAAN